MQTITFDQKTQVKLSQTVVICSDRLLVEMFFFRNFFFKTDFECRASSQEDGATEERTEDEWLQYEVT